MGRFALLNAEKPLKIRGLSASAENGGSEPKVAFPQVRGTFQQVAEKLDNSKNNSKVVADSASDDR